MNAFRSRSWVRVLGGLCALLLLLPVEADAYPWMIRHGYNACASCHVDPSGGGLLTPYGRAQAELLVAANYGKTSEGEVSPTTQFMLGAIPLPESLNLALSFRGGALVNRAGATTSIRPVQMATDLRAAAQAGPVRALASVGFALRRALLAAVTSGDENNVVSRDHWLGIVNEEESLLLRAGRIPLPFGLRMPEHIQWVRERTRTDINEHQQHGVALAYATEKVRAEVMGIVGNFQVHPAAYRERGYSGFAEYSLFPQLAVGVSSLITQARVDYVSRDPFLMRHAHGLFLRWAPAHPLVISGELNLLAYKPQGQPGGVGHASLLQADYEPVQGFHLIATAETLEDRGVQGLGGWLSAAWFITHFAEVRVDTILREQSTSTSTNHVLTVFTQLHLSL